MSKLPTFITPLLSRRGLLAAPHDADRGYYEKIETAHSRLLSCSGSSMVPGDDVIGRITVDRIPIRVLSDVDGVL